jgi:hypothetical protein
MSLLKVFGRPDSVRVRTRASIPGGPTIVRSRSRGVKRQAEEVIGVEVADEDRLDLREGDAALLEIASATGEQLQR